MYLRKDYNNKGVNSMKTWEIYHYNYGDVCSDSYFGKTSRCITMGFVTDTEDNVKSLVNKLNLKNHSYYAQDEPENAYDEDYADEDYISYREVRISTLEKIENIYSIELEFERRDTKEKNDEYRDN